MKWRQLILASASPRRIELLRRLKLKFRVVPSEAREVQSGPLTAAEIAQMNAFRKARSVAERFPDALVLSADTVVSLENTLFGKPASLAEAERMLRRLQGHTHQVVTGVCLIHLRMRRQKLFAECTQVTFRRLTRKQIREYLASIDPFDKAGAYAIQEGGDALVREIDGSFTNVIGLPMERLEAELRSWHGCGSVSDRVLGGRSPN